MRVGVWRVHNQSDCYADLGVNCLSVSLCDGCHRPLPEEHLHENRGSAMAHGWGQCGTEMPAGFCDENCRDTYRLNMMVADLERRGFKVHGYR